MSPLNIPGIFKEDIYNLQRAFNSHCFMACLGATVNC